MNMFPPHMRDSLKMFPEHVRDNMRLIPNSMRKRIGLATSTVSSEPTITPDLKATLGALPAQRGGQDNG